MLKMFILRNSSQGPSYIIKSVDKTKLSCYTPTNAAQQFLWTLYCLVVYKYLLCYLSGRDSLPLAKYEISFYDTNIKKWLFCLKYIFFWCFYRSSPGAAKKYSQVPSATNELKELCRELFNAVKDCTVRT